MFSSSLSLAESGLPREARPAAPAERPPMLDPVVVTGTRVDQPSFLLPFSIDVVDAAVIRDGRPLTDLSEALARVPGLTIQNRRNYAQDLQISSRGFGARSTFGIRGVRLIVDDIPLTMPDGQGQAATINLGSIERIEVLRGPFSAVYGNAPGGVIQAFTEKGPPGTAFDAVLHGGSYGATRAELKLGGTLGRAPEGSPDDAGPFNYVVDVSRFETRGYRDHSAAARYQANVKLVHRLGRDTSLTLVVNELHQGDTQDPLGLTRVQMEADPRQAGANAMLYNTRKRIDNTQGGVVFEHRLSPAHTVKLIGYAGAREILQFLAIPPAAQAASTHSGGVVDLDRRFGGAGLRWTYRSGGMRPLVFTAGIDYDGSRERRKGFENFAGTALGVRGALRRDESGTVTSFGQYAQAEWRFMPSWTLSAGVRHTEVKFRSEDFFVRGGNPDDSGRLAFRHVNPVLGLAYAVTPGLSLYASTGSGFETPTFAELGYRPDGASGLNLALRPSRSLNLEAGLKWLPTNATRVNLAFFQASVRGEILPATSSGGRTTFQNAADTLRRGVEFSLDSRIGREVSAFLSYTHLDATFRDTYAYRPGVGPGTVTVSAGNALPGVPRNTGYAELAWGRGRPGFSAAVEAIVRDRVFVNDTNTEAARGYAIANLRAAYMRRFHGWKLAGFVRVDNVAGARYSGSVIVNEANGRYYEPAPGRHYMAGVSAGYAF